MVVPDAISDPRFAHNPLVTHEPNIRFYAGAPLTTPDGYNVGILCVIDRVPRDLTKQQCQSLQVLSLLVMAQLELRPQLLERDLFMEQLQDAVKEVKILSGMLPICATCKLIRNEKGEWIQLESYIREQSEAEFTHGICPSCKKALFFELNQFPNIVTTGMIFRTLNVKSPIESFLRR